MWYVAGRTLLYQLMEIRLYLFRREDAKLLRGNRRRLPRNNFYPPLFMPPLRAGRTPLRRNYKILPITKVNKVDHLPFQIGVQKFFNKQLNTAQIKPVIVFIRLIQSQPQTGAASTKTFKHHPQHLAGVLGQNRLQSCLRCIRNLHSTTPVKYI